MCECVRRCAFVSEQHRFVLMCEASDRRSTGCSHLRNPFVYLKIVTDGKRLDIFMDTTITVILFIEIQTKAFLPSLHVFSKCLPLISKSTTRVEFTETFMSNDEKLHCKKETSKLACLTQLKPRPLPTASLHSLVHLSIKVTELSSNTPQPCPLCSVSPLEVSLWKKLHIIICES